MRSGMTIISVVVAASLAGIVALAIGRLIGSQAQTMTAIKLREQREELLKHYKHIVVSGWDATRGGSCSGVICDRSGNIVIPYANGSALYLPDTDPPPTGSGLYDYGHTGGTADRWWKVTAHKKLIDSGSAGRVLQADTYAQPDALIAMSVKVEFIRDEHPTVSTRLADSEEIVFLHHNTSGAVGSNDTDCKDGDHLTQLRTSGGSALYSGTGAIVQYDFNSNYTKCSQVPLVVPLVNEATVAGTAGALIGFFRASGTGAQLVTGNPIYSTKHHGSALAEISGSSEKRTVKAIDCSGRGYIKQINSNEEPVCVSPSGVTPERVAAQSVPLADWRELEADGGAKVTKNFTVLRRRTPGGDGVRATYSSATCPVERYKTIDSFNSDGTVNYRAYHNYHPPRLDYDPPRSTPGYRLKGWQGPRGEPGANSDSESLRGAPGTCGYKYCCRMRTCRYSYTCDRDGDGRWDETCTRTYQCRRRC